MEDWGGALYGDPRINATSANTLKGMSLIRTQAIVSITIPVHDMGRAAENLRQALAPYEGARIISLTTKTNWFQGWTGRTSLLAAIDYEPATTAN